MDRSAAASESRTSRFELAPPRRFILPAILLLLSENPGYGYGLVPLLKEFRFGHVDRPAIYRALAQLESDGLVQASSQSPTAGQARRVYRVTPLGERVLRMWMGVIKEEYDYLGQVLRRYQATGTADAVLAEVEGGWATALGFGWSPVSSSSSGSRVFDLVDFSRGGKFDGSDTSSARGGPTKDAAHDDLPNAKDVEDPKDAVPRRFELLPERSVVLIEVRSTVGPLSFGVTGVTGWVEAVIAGGILRTEVPPTARLEIDVAGLKSGNDLYDAELQRRIDARRYPSATVELRECEASGASLRYGLTGDLTFHGVTRPAQGTVHVEAMSDERLVITGEQVFDIRDFAIPSPTVLMLRIYPDVRVRLHAETESQQPMMKGRKK
ncbi:MAG: helix-turn-helix transcriptional regulator [Acidimicrobiales bacterium]